MKEYALVIIVFWTLLGLWHLGSWIKNRIEGRKQAATHLKEMKNP